MKIIKLIALGILLSLSNLSHAQIILDVNLAMEPVWGIIPIDGPRYEYYPDQEMYYDRQTYMYVYFNGSSWGRSAYVPQAFLNINLGSARRARIDDYRGRTPYLYINDHRRLYGRGDNDHGRDFGKGNEHVEQGHDNGFHGNDNRGHENMNRGGNENHGGGNERKGGGEHGGKK